MKVISWDIGIKNLAFCVIDYDYDNVKPLSESDNDPAKLLSELNDDTVKPLSDSDNDPVKPLQKDSNNGVIKKILKWDIINLIPDADKCYISSCKKPATHECEYYCKPIKWCPKHGSIYDKLKKTDANNITPIVPIKIINCLNINVDVVRKTLIQKLDMIVLPLIYELKIDYTLIENQPTLKNPRMKAISDTVYCWFLIRGLIDSKIIKSIHFISPGNKLKDYAEELTNSENKYKSTKMKSISVVNDYFDNNTLRSNLELEDIVKWKKHLSNYSKKDDLCDALLQGFYWIDKNKPVIKIVKQRKPIKEKIKKKSKNDVMLD